MKKYYFIENHSIQTIPIIDEFVKWWLTFPHAFKNSCPWETVRWVQNNKKVWKGVITTKKRIDKLRRRIKVASDKMRSNSQVHEPRLDFICCLFSVVTLFKAPRHCLLVKNIPWQHIWLPTCTIETLVISWKLSNLWIQCTSLYLQDVQNSQLKIIVYLSKRHAMNMFHSSTCPCLLPFQLPPVHPSFCGQQSSVFN